MAISGTSLNLSREIFRPVVGFFGPLTPLPADTIPKLRKAARAPHLNWDQAGALALDDSAGRAPAWHIRYIAYLPDRDVWRVRMVEPGFRQEAFRIREDQVYLRDGDGEVIRHIGYDQGTAGDRFVEWQYPLHTGRMFGLLGRILTCLTGLVVATLSITGVYIWWKKRVPRVRQRRAQRHHSRARSS